MAQQFNAIEIRTAESVTVLDEGRTLIAKLRTRNGQEMSLALPFRQAKGLFTGLVAALAKAAERAAASELVSFFTPAKVVVSAVPGEAEAIFLSFDLDGAEMTMRLDAGTAQAMASTVNETLARQRAHRTTAH